MITNKIKLTAEGRRKVDEYIEELKEEQKDILDAHKDSADRTNLPDYEDIEDSVEFNEEDYGDGYEYVEYWGVTNNYDSVFALSLVRGIDYN